MVSKYLDKGRKAFFYIPKRHLKTGRITIDYEDIIFIEEEKYNE